jgi:hypothetical protein
MPKNVRRFVWLWLGSFVIALGSIPLMPPPSSLELELGITRPIQIVFVLGIVAIIFAVLLPFFWLAVWRRRNWARWVLFVSFAVTTPFFFDPILFDRKHLPLLGIGLVSLLVEAAGFYFLFTGDAVPWFRREISN